MELHHKMWESIPNCKSWKPKTVLTVPYLAKKWAEKLWNSAADLSLFENNFIPLIKQRCPSMCQTLFNVTKIETALHPFEWTKFSPLPFDQYCQTGPVLAQWKQWIPLKKLFSFSFSLSSQGKTSQEFICGISFCSIP